MVRSLITSQNRFDHVPVQKGTILKIDFDYERGEKGDVDKRIAFWSSQNTIEWFEMHGYTLYTLGDKDSSGWTTVPTLTFAEEVCEGEYPYATYDGTPAPVTEFTDTVPLRAYEANGKVVFAQDDQNRHVAIKLVRLGSDEHRILQFLRDQPLDTLKENCVLPVLDIQVPFTTRSLWGNSVVLPKHRTIKEVLHMMHDMLKGLAFLHRHNIIHGDIYSSNSLEDDFRDSYFSLDYGLRTTRRYEGHTRYAIFDFDLSRQVPQEVNRRDYWISTNSDFAWGTFNVTMDYAQGELEYNPFITDVGALGVMFSHQFHYAIPHLPILAPFFDMLTTHKLRQRFTASEAHAFFEDFYGDLSEEELEKEL
ncbi:hypothetical protein CPC08DRAFT_698056, partial [Agrocybe pediades]